MQQGCTLARGCRMCMKLIVITYSRACGAGRLTVIPNCELTSCKSVQRTMCLASARSTMLTADGVAIQQSWTCA